MKKERFEVLDGLRGVAALVVLSFHLVQQQDLKALPFAGLSVDFFYVLSGFVVAYAYDDPIQSGSMTFSGFALVRLKRLYPLLFLGTMIGIGLAFLALLTKQLVGLGDVLAAACLALLLLPSFIFPQWETAYPFNMAAWSLTFEAFVNAVYVLIGKRLSNIFLWYLVCFGLLLLVANALVNNGIAGGNNQDGFFFGFL